MVKSGWHRQSHRLVSTLRELPRAKHLASSDALATDSFLLLAVMHLLLVAMHLRVEETAKEEHLSKTLKHRT